MGISGNSRTAGERAALLLAIAWLAAAAWIGVRHWGELVADEIPEWGTR
jgi:hypothetical protein